jgi:hypothetical protein
MSPDASWSSPVQLVALDVQGGRVLKSRTFDPGVLQIAVGRLRGVPIGDIQIASSGIDQ